MAAPPEGRRPPAAGDSPAAPCAVSCFITGTDTGVGKTLVSAALVRAMAATGPRVTGMKPVAAGAERHDGVWRNEDVEMLFAAGNAGTTREDICPCLLPDPMAPHIAAERAGVPIRVADLVAAYHRLAARADAVVVEGVGGFCVPLGEDGGTADLARALALPVVLVVGLRLGCLNHAVLTAEAVAARGLPLAGWIANTIDPRMAELDRNVLALERLIPAPCLGRIPWLTTADVDAAGACLDLTALAAATRTAGESWRH